MARILRTEPVEILWYGLVVAAREHLGQVFAADPHAGRADFEVIGFRFGPRAAQRALMPGDVAAVQTAAFAAGDGGFLAGLRAVFDQCLFLEHHRSRACARAAVATIDRVPVPVVDAEQTIVADALQHEVAALVVTDTHETCFEPRAQFAAEAGNDAAIAEIQFAHQSGVGHVAATGQCSRRHGLQLRIAQVRQRRQLFARFRIATAIAADAQRVAALRVTSANPQFFRDLGADFRRPVTRAQRGQTVEIGLWQRDIVGIHRRRDFGQRAAQQFCDHGFTGFRRERRRAFAAFRRRCGVFARVGFGMFRALSIAVDRLHARERHAFIAVALQHRVGREVRAGDTGVDVRSAGAGRGGARGSARGDAFQHESLAERRLHAGDRTAVGADGVFVGRIALVDVVQA